MANSKHLNWKQLIVFDNPCTLEGTLSSPSVLVLRLSNRASLRPVVFFELFSPCSFSQSQSFFGGGLVLRSGGLPSTIIIYCSVITDNFGRNTFLFVFAVLVATCLSDRTKIITIIIILGTFWALSTLEARLTRSLTLWRGNLNPVAGCHLGSSTMCLNCVQSLPNALFIPESCGHFGHMPCLDHGIQWGQNIFIFFLIWLSHFSSIHQCRVAMCLPLCLWQVLPRVAAGNSCLVHSVSARHDPLARRCLMH